MKREVLEKEEEGEEEEEYLPKELVAQVDVREDGLKKENDSDSDSSP